MPLKIKDIAADAGVSIATVSRVLNGSQTVAAALRARVMASVQRMGYHPNMVARSLRTRKSFVLGVIIPTIANPFFTDIVQGIEHAASSAGYITTILSSDQDLAKEHRNLQVLHDRRVDGVLIAVADRQASDLSQLTNAGVPVVLVDRRLDGAQLDSVTVDTRRGAYSAVEFLVQRGYKRIGLLGGPSTVSTAADKLDGYRAALEDNGIVLDQTLVLLGDYTEASGRDLGRRLLSMAHPPEAVLVANNVMTLGFFTVVREYGLRVPHELAFIGFDDRPWSSLVMPPITMVDQPTYDLGRLATETLLERIIGDGADGWKNQLLRTKLIVRSSC